MDLDDYKIKALETSKNIELGKPMAPSTGKSQFPVCPDNLCWCHDCSMTRVKATKYDNDLNDYILEVLQSARKLKLEYLSK